MKVKVGIIGGTGLDDPGILEGRRETFVDTPFGKPSDALIHGKIKAVECVLLSRHGRRHSIMPTNVNYRANIWAMKDAGCTHVVVSNACGSLKENISPGDLVFLDQYINLTKMRASTFYDGGEKSPKGVCHYPMHTPFCPHTRKILMDVADQLGYKHHKSGTIVVIEGPAFSCKAESNLYRSWGADTIGMTTVPEVILANEAGMSYASVGLATDYDCWREDKEAVRADAVVEVMKTNSQKAMQIFLNAIPKIAEKDWSSIMQERKDILKSAVMLS